MRCRANHSARNVACHAAQAHTSMLMILIYIITDIIYKILGPEYLIIDSCTVKNRQSICMKKACIEDCDYLSITQITQIMQVIYIYQMGLKVTCAIIQCL